ncbi:hypothetical protein BC831DRAFT_447178 [Entophlyctis helioformis]|nr:hypothetical protein BC831DRAFT_447178 [Entophlyctis helioformis]
MPMPRHHSTDHQTDGRRCANALCHPGPSLSQTDADHRLAMPACHSLPIWHHKRVTSCCKTAPHPSKHHIPDPSFSAVGLIVTDRDREAETEHRTRSAHSTRSTNSLDSGRCCSRQHRVARRGQPHRTCKRLPRAQWPCGCLGSPAGEDDRRPARPREADHCAFGSPCDGCERCLSL